MRGLGLLSKHRRLVIGIIAVLVVGWCFAFEPVTRNFVAQDSTCLYCHLPREYEHTARLSFTKQHPVELKDNEQAARCVDCHLPKGFWSSAFLYTHFASATDLYGHFRDRPKERAGDWIPLSAARAYRVRDRLLEYDSVTCRSCHVMAEIKPRQPRGQKAHEDAIRDNQTCMECHANVVHRYVEVRTTTADTGSDEDMDEGLDDLEEPGGEDSSGAESEEMEVL